MAIYNPHTSEINEHNVEHRPNPHTNIMGQYMSAMQGICMYAQHHITCVHVHARSNVNLIVDVCICFASGSIPEVMKSSGIRGCPALPKADRLPSSPTVPLTHISTVLHLHSQLLRGRYCGERRPLPQTCRADRTGDWA